MRASCHSSLSVSFPTLSKRAFLDSKIPSSGINTTISMPASNKEHLRPDNYTHQLLTRMAHFDSIEGTMNDSIGSLRSKLSDEAIVDLEEYINTDSIYEKEENLERTVILESTDQGFTVVPYPLHCEPVYGSQGSQSSSEDGTCSSSRGSTATSGTQSPSQASAAPGCEMINGKPFDDVNVLDPSDSDLVQDSDHIPHPTPFKIESQCPKAPMHHASHIPQHTVCGISGAHPAAGVYRAYSPPLTSGIPFLPSSQDGYPSPRLGPLEEEAEGEASIDFLLDSPTQYKQEDAEISDYGSGLSTILEEAGQVGEIVGGDEEELRDLYESIFGRDGEDVFEAPRADDEPI